MYKKVLATIMALFFMNSAYAQYDYLKFGSEIQAIKNRIDQKKVAAAAIPGGVAAAAVPDTIQNDQYAELHKQIEACKKTMDGMVSMAQAKMKRSEAWALSGAVTGLLGSVAAGHVSTVIVGLLSGTAGLANTAQQIYKDQGDTPQAVLKTRSGLRKDAAAAIDEYSKATNDDERWTAMSKLHFACTAYEMSIEAKESSPDAK